MLRIYLCGLVLLALTYCSGEGSGGGLLAPSATPIDRNRELVETISTKIIPAQNQRLRDAALTFDQSVQAACLGTDVPLDDLRQQWWAVMSQFHLVDTIAYGPLAENRNELRDRLYSWPIYNEIAVEDEMVAANEDPDGYVFEQDLFEQIGLDAVEYILFSYLGDQDVLNKDSIACPYLPMVTADIVDGSETLVSDFQSKEVAVSKDLATREDYKDVIRRIVQSLQFFEDSVKESKLGIPLNKSAAVKCKLGVNCQQYLEHGFSHSSKQALLKNLEGFANVFYGTTEDGDEFGFRDYMVDAGFVAEVTKVDTSISKLKTLLEGFPDGEAFADLVKSFEPKACSEASLCSLYNEVEGLASWIKGEFIVLMGKDLPIGVQGDAD